MKIDGKRSGNISSHLVLRGAGCDDIDLNSISLNDPRMYSNAFCDNSLKIWSHNRPFCRYDKSITALTNGRDSISALNQTTNKAWNMFNTDAFLYQYEKYGLGRSHFLDCFANTEQIIHNYMAL